MSSSTENEVQLCGNCKKEIPTANFTIHEIHCWRNIALCQICSEPFPKSEMKEHLETEHTQVTCRCNLKMDRSEMENHKISECPLRLVKCKYCELELCFDKLSEHDSYCGARTEPCSICGSNVMVKDLDKHPEVCGKTSEMNNNKIKSNPLHHLERDAGAWFEEDHFGRILSSMSYRRPAHQVMLPHMRTFRTTLDVAAPRRRIVKPAVHQRTMDQNQANDTMLPCEFCEELFPEEDLLVHQTGCNTVSAFSSFTKKSSNPQVQLDHGGVFQSFPQSPSDQDVLDDAFESTYFGPSEPAEDNIVIPCEFCGTLLEEEVLFHHQDKCDFRHATTRSIERPSAGHCAPKWENTERRKPSETGHRKHQEDFDGSYLDSVSPCKPIRTVARIPAKSVSVSRTAPQKFSPDVTGGSSTFKNPSRKGTFTTQVGTETQNNKNPSEFKQSTYASNGSSRTLMEKNDPNFSRASPHRGRPSLKTEVSRNPRTTAASNLRMHPTKVNSKKPHVDDSDNTDE